jgi:hypothetical protein
MSTKVGVTGFPGWAINPELFWFLVYYFNMLFHIFKVPE